MGVSRSRSWKRHKPGQPSAFVKRNGRTVGVTDPPIELQAIKEALGEFP
jgi:hypothetical protein